jgi:phosphoserine phosphatase RsbU/P
MGWTCFFNSTDKSDSMDDSLLTLARSNALLGELSSVTIARLLTLGQTVELAGQEILIKQGDQSDCAYLILDGNLDIQVSTDYGEVLVARVSEGALVGEIGAFAELPRNATIRACGHVRALRLSRAHLLEAGNTDPAFLRSIIGRLGGQISRFNSVIALYTNAVAALEQDNFDISILDELKQPSPELIDFAEHFRRMADHITRRRAEQAEMASAAAIQRAMLPNAKPADLIDGRFDVFASIVPARQVGGDLYDIVALGENKILITIGDVCGKGIPAALFMAMTQTVVRLTVHSGHDLQSEIGRANNLLVANNKEDMFATFFCGVLDTSSGELEYCNCGHNPPLILHRGSGAFESLRTSGPPLGVTDDINYRPQSIVLGPDDLLLMYTDGVTEAENAQTAQFGSQRLQDAILEIGGQPAQKIVEHVIERVVDFANGAPQSDDITCIAIVQNAT